MISTTVTPEHTGVLFLGRKGEKDAREFVFDLSNWVLEMVTTGAPIGEVILLVLRPRERTPYRATVTASGTDLVWVPQPEDLAKTGEGSIELQLVTPNGAILKSAIIRTRTEGCLGDSEGPAPEDQPGWFRQVLANTETVRQSAKEALAAAVKAEAAAEEASQAAATTSTEVVFVDFGTVAGATILQAFESGKTVICRRESGVADYPKTDLLLLTEMDHANSETARFTNGDHWAVYYFADPELLWDYGDLGSQGEPGYTPVRGKDYWTEADIAEIKSYVDGAILGGAW